MIATPAGFGSWIYVLEDGDEPLATIKPPSILNKSGEITMGAVPFAIEAEGLTGGTLRLLFEGLVVATAERQTSFWRRYHVTLDASLAVDTPTDLVLASQFGIRAFALEADGERLGMIRRASLLRRNAEVEILESVPLVVKAFCLAVVLVEWRRSS
ncbi:hypothetical protein [Rubrivirga sp.]|uniref:hypothetical protein n=1 Tax=Rubrivirga sp. TaxID=1885344 RepID=UPI003C757219